MEEEGRSDLTEQDARDIDESVQNRTDRAQRIMNAMVNTSIILMSELMGGFTQVMVGTFGAVASEMAGTMGGEGARESVAQEFEDKLPEVDGKMKGMISDMRRDIYAQLRLNKDEIEPALTDPAYDMGPGIIDGYDFKLPKLTEELDDASLVRYSQLLVEEDPSFVEMFNELIGWLNTLPKFPDKSDS